MAAERSGYTERLIRKLESGGPIDRQTIDDVIVAYNDHISVAQQQNVHDLVTDDASDRLKQRADQWLNKLYHRRNPDLVMEDLSADVTLVAPGGFAHGKDAFRDYLKQILFSFNPIQY